MEGSSNLSVGFTCKGINFLILRDSLVGLKRMIHTHETVGSNPILATHGGSLAMIIKSQEAVGKLIIMK